MESVVRWLVEFLETSPPDADLRVISWRTGADSEIQCEMETGSPWWIEARERSTEIGTLGLAFRGVVGSRVNLRAQHIDTEEFTASQDEPLLWSFGPQGTLFGNAPVRDALPFVAELADWILTQRAPLDLWEYLGFSPLNEFAAKLRHQTYHLLSGPLPILNAACRMLEARHIPYFLKPSPARDRRRLTAVWIGRSWVVCEDATVSLSTRAS